MIATMRQLNHLHFLTATVTAAKAAIAALSITMGSFVESAATEQNASRHITDKNGNAQSNL